MSIVGISGRAGSGKDLTANIIQYLTSGSQDIMSYEEYQTSQSEYRFDSTWQIKKFASAVKQICSILTGIPIEDFEKEEVKNSYLGEEWNHYNFYASHGKVTNKVCKTRKEAINRLPKGYLLDGKPVIVKGINEKYTVRELLQKVGTDAMRNVIHPDVWINVLMKDFKPQSKESYERFKWELDQVSGIVLPDYLEVCPKWIISDVRFPNECKAIKDRGGIVIRVNRLLTIGEDDYGYVKVSIEQAIKAGIMAPQHESETSLDNYKFDYVIENDSSVEELIEEVRKMLIYFKIL